MNMPLTLTAAAEALNISTRHLTRLIDQGRIQGSVRIGVTRPEIARYIAAREALRAEVAHARANRDVYRDQRIAAAAGLTLAEAKEIGLRTEEVTS